MTELCGMSVYFQDIDSVATCTFHTSSGTASVSSNGIVSFLFKGCPVSLC